jgi:hypothetical protein
VASNRGLVEPRLRLQLQLQDRLDAVSMPALSAAQLPQLQTLACQITDEDTMLGGAPDSASLSTLHAQAAPVQEQQMDLQLAVVDTVDAFERWHAAGAASAAGAGASASSALAPASPRDERPPAEVQSVLSAQAAALDELLGNENAASAEARFCLALWGLMSAAHSEADVRRQLERHLVAVARGAPAGRVHPLVARLHAVYATRFGAFAWPAEAKGGDDEDHVHDENCEFRR